MTILLVSPFIDCQAVGEPRWCYDLARAISARTRTIIVAQTPRNRNYRIAELFPDAEVHEHAPWQMDWISRRTHALFKPNYVQFYRQAARAIAQIPAATIRCAHHFGPLGLRFPTPLRGAGIPYIIGPLGGSLPLPAAFGGERSRQPWYSFFRDFDGMRFRHDPWLRSSYENAAYVVGVAPYVRDLLVGMKLRYFENRPEFACTGTIADLDAIIAQRQARQGPIRFVMASRLVFTKGVQYALRAAAALPHNLDWRIDILGEGPMRLALEAMIRDLALADRVTLHGHVPRAKVDDFYREADVFLFPSIREPSGAVVFEAMAWGLPIIAANYGGPAAHVRDAFGIRVPVGDQAAFVRGIGEGMQRLIQTADLRRAMGKAAACSAREDNSIDAMADYYLRLYDRIGRPEAVLP